VSTRALVILSTIRPILTITHTHKYIYIYIYIYVYMDIYMCVCMYIYVYVYIYVICIIIYIYIYIYVYVICIIYNIYIFNIIHTHTHTHLGIHTYIHTYITWQRLQGQCATWYSRRIVDDRPSLRSQTPPPPPPANVSICQHASAYVSIRQYERGAHFTQDLQSFTDSQVIHIYIPMPPLLKASY
jgi:Ca2+/Na+ antiporter